MFITEFGWDNWSVAICRLGKWNEIIRKLVDLESMVYETPVLALIEGMIKAAMLLLLKCRKFSSKAFRYTEAFVRFFST